MEKRSIIFLFVVFILQGCALQIGVLNPKPDLNLIEKNKSIKLAINDNIKDSFTIPEYGGIKNSKIINWRFSLKKGFESGFERFYSIKDNNSTSDLTLQLLKTDIKLVPTTINGYNSSTVLKAQISFTTALINKNGKEISKFDAIALSENTINHKGQENKVVENAIENMYQIIAKQLFL